MLYIQFWFYISIVYANIIYPCPVLEQLALNKSFMLVNKVPFIYIQITILILSISISECLMQIWHIKITYQQSSKFIRQSFSDRIRFGLLPIKLAELCWWILEYMKIGYNILANFKQLPNFILLRFLTCFQSVGFFSKNFTHADLLIFIYLYSYFSWTWPDNFFIFIFQSNIWF